MKLKVKIAVAANANGQWHACGFNDAKDWVDCMDSFDLLRNEQRFWIEAEIEVADEPAAVPGTASAA